MPRPRRIRLLGNLVFGTRDHRFGNSLKSAASVSEKHEADKPAETADSGFLKQTTIHHRSEFATDCYEGTCGDLAGDSPGGISPGGLPGRGFGELTFLRKSEYWGLLVVWGTLSSLDGVSPRQ
ncbi:MAG: hypothetical protein DWI00_15175 [Planctomycetota bacterium]|nr:MAG: hypothetical protein DWI00_15175 [Planctomycetota bacterium]